MSQFLIYGLRDPRTAEIRYVGKSARGMDRPVEHFPPPKVDNTYKARWLRKLLALGLTAEIVVLEVCDLREDLSSREMWWIVIGRAALGKRFTNLTAGGDGCHDPTPETRAKMGAAISATKNRPEVKALICETSKEISTRPEVRAKKSIGMKDAWQQPGYAEAHSVALIAAWSQPEVRAKHSVSAKAAHARPETKERHRASIVAAWARPEDHAKRVATIKKALDRPEVRKKLSASLKIALNRPEVKEKIAANMRAIWARRKANALPRVRINLLRKESP